MKSNLWVVEARVVGKMKKEIFAGWLLLVSMWLLIAEVHANSQINQTEPKQMIQQVSDLVVSSLNAHRSEFEADGAKVLKFAQDNVLPYIDTEKMARYALGKYWRNASVQQQQDFTAAFTENLIRSYSQSLLNLQIEKVEVSDLVLEKPEKGSVNSTIYQKEGKPAEVIYRVFQDKDGKWYMYDVVIENVSMLLSYRNLYQNVVGSNGLDKMIADLQEKNRQAVAK